MDVRQQYWNKKVAEWKEEIETLTAQNKELSKIKIHSTDKKEAQEANNNKLGNYGRIQLLEKQIAEVEKYGCIKPRK